MNGKTAFEVPWLASSSIFFTDFEEEQAANTFEADSLKNFKGVQLVPGSRKSCETSGWAEVAGRQAGKILDVPQVSRR